MYSGLQPRLIVTPPKFPNADAIAKAGTASRQDSSHVDVMLVNPPSPDGAVWIQSQHRVGRRWRENMIWPLVSLAQMAALLSPTYNVRVVDAIADSMGWKEFEQLLRNERPKYYVTQLTPPTLQNDLYGTFLAKSLTLRDFIDHLEGKQFDRPNAISTLFRKHDSTYQMGDAPGPICTYLKMLVSDVNTMKSAVTLGLRHLGWARA